MKKFTFTFVVATLVAFSSFLLTGCGNKTESEICDEVESGVVLVLNCSYYEFVLPNEESLYFTSYDSEEGIKGLATDEDSVEYSISYGTGFFITEDGMIATNAHVVASTDNESDINSGMKDIFDALKLVVAAQYADYYEKYEKAEELANEARYSDEYSASDYQYICSIRDALKNELDDLASTYQELDDINVRDCNIIYHNAISVAFNDTYVTGFSDFEKCVIRKCDDEHDVAIIQLKDKHTPEGRNVFYVPYENPLKNYSFSDKMTRTFGDDKNEKLVMIGFNYGPILALTDDGIRCQHTSGSISQESSSHLMYSIPALHGSSGSPVLNMSGELVAVNFAGLSTTQSFTYGVYVKHLRNLMDEIE